MISYSITKHAVAMPLKTLCREGGRHILNITLTNDHDNGEFVGKGTWLELDRYEEDTPTTFEGIVRAKAANGNYIVEVVKTVNAYMIYQVPVIEEEYNTEFKKLENFYNADGETVRCYDLAPLDIIELSEKAFVGGAPSVGATVTLSGNKLA